MWMEKLKLEPLCLIKRDAQQHPLLMWLLASIRRNSFCFSSIYSPFPPLLFEWELMLFMHVWFSAARLGKDTSFSLHLLPSFLFSSPLLTFFPISVSFIVLTFVFNTSSLFPLLLPCHPLPHSYQAFRLGCCVSAVVIDGMPRAEQLSALMCAWISFFPSLIPYKKSMMNSAEIWDQSQSVWIIL